MLFATCGHVMYFVQLQFYITTNPETEQRSFDSSMWVMEYEKAINLFFEY